MAQKARLAYILEHACPVRILSTASQSSYEPEGSHHNSIENSRCLQRSLVCLKTHYQMCFVQVERWLCPTQCGRVVRKFDGTINVCEGQEVYHSTGDDSALEDCTLAVDGTPDRIPYNAGFADVLCNECHINEARELYQERRQMVYIAQNREPPMATGWEEVPDWNVYLARSETMAPRGIFDQGRWGGGGQ